MQWAVHECMCLRGFSPIPHASNNCICYMAVKKTAFLPFYVSFCLSFQALTESDRAAGKSWSRLPRQCREDMWQAWSVLYNDSFSLSCSVSRRHACTMTSLGGFLNETFILFFVGLLVLFQSLSVDLPKGSINTLSIGGLIQVKSDFVAGHGIVSLFLCVHLSHSWSSCESVPWW